MSVKSAIKSKFRTISKKDRLQQFYLGALVLALYYYCGDDIEYTDFFQITF